MASEPLARPRFYLVVPQQGDAGAAARALPAVLRVLEAAAVLLELPDGEDAARTYAGAFAAPVQDCGAALLLGGGAELVPTAGADGAHLTGLAALRSALPALKGGSIAGAGGLHTRHDAMTAAEIGADYVMFGEPSADGARPAPEAVVERIAWWAEVFEVPCVGYAAAVDEITPLARARADFIALGPWLFDDPAGLVSAAKKAQVGLMAEAAS